LQATKNSSDGPSELASKLAAAEEKLAATEKEVKEVLALLPLKYGTWGGS
jgi:hypothetical protein